MIRQAHTYLVGALSGVVVIVIAIGAFVVLVSAQVFYDLPIPALSGHDQKTAVATGKAVAAPEHRPFASIGGVTPGTGRPATNGKGAGHTGGAARPRGGGKGAATSTHESSPPAGLVETAPSAGTEHPGGGGSGSRSHHPSSSTGSPSPGPSGSSGVGPASGTSSGSPGTSGSGTSAGGSSGSGGGSTGTSGGGPTITLPPTPVTTAKPSEVITESVNEVVKGANGALGGSLEEVGATHVTEEAVNGAAGPESVVGKTVDGVSEVVGGLVGGGGH
ncbi:MAG: hypothetical protein JSU06_07900 [Actinobacteria bacterium]|nr:hypothetical protein [Actinomycetota bacterium]